ncbi:unnamed protein product [Orchesella dallaii]|uniref:CCHC-type domain-containing protein n=1 Tax=Orchesella dallaii TaxID=48710 RepID=A0ABP1QVN6_9HEXA
MTRGIIRDQGTFHGNAFMDSDTVSGVEKDLQNLHRMYSELKNSQEAENCLDDKIVRAFSSYHAVSSKKSNLNLHVDIPTYSGMQERKTAYDFLKELEAYKLAMCCTYEDIIKQILPVCLKDEAFDWYIFVRERIDSWEIFVSMFRKEFQPPGYYDELRKELDARTQGTGEPLTSYIRIIKDFYDRLDKSVDEQIIVKRILRQMHPHYRFILTRSGKDFCSLMDLMEEARHAQEYIYQDSQYREPKYYNIVEPSLACKSPILSNNPIMEVQESSYDNYRHFHKSEDLQYLQSETEQSSKNSCKRCYCCRRIGHIKRDCSQFRHCLQMFYGRVGERASQNDSFTTNVEPVMQVKLCNRSFPALLDTGASSSFVNKDVINILRFLKVPTFLQGTKILTANDVITVNERVELVLEWHGRKTRHTFLLLPDLDRPVILGRDFIAACGLRIEIRRGGWQVGNEQLVPFYNNYLQHNIHSGHEVPVPEYVLSTNIHGGEVTLDSSAFKSFPPKPFRVSVDARARYHTHRRERENTRMAHKHMINNAGLDKVGANNKLGLETATRPMGKSELAGVYRDQVRNKLADHKKLSRDQCLSRVESTVRVNTPRNFRGYRHKKHKGTKSSSKKATHSKSQAPNVQSRVTNAGSTNKNRVPSRWVNDYKCVVLLVLLLSSCFEIGVLSKGNAFTSHRYADNNVCLFENTNLSIYLTAHIFMIYLSGNILFKVLFGYRLQVSESIKRWGLFKSVKLKYILPGIIDNLLQYLDIQFALLHQEWSTFAYSLVGLSRVSSS